MVDVDYYKSLPRKRAGAGVLFFNERKELLIAKPTYKDYWTIPGGTVDANESPRQCAMREVKEELGLEQADVKFLAIDYVANNKEKGEAFHFIFYGGVLSVEDIARIRLPKEELHEYRFVKSEKLVEFLGQRVFPRISVILQNAVKDGKPVYLENGERI